MHSKIARYPALAALFIGLSGCIGTSEFGSDTARTDVLRGKALFADQCAVCHGDDGRGAGDASLGLGAPPPSLTTLSQRNGGVFPRNYVMSMIDGLSREGHPDMAMPQFGNEDLGPLVQVESDGTSTPIPADLLALSNYLELIQE